MAPVKNWLPQSNAAFVVAKPSTRMGKGPVGRRPGFYVHYNNAHNSYWNEISLSVSKPIYLIKQYCNVKPV